MYRLTTMESWARIWCQWARIWCQCTAFRPPWWLQLLFVLGRRFYFCWFFVDCCSQCGVLCLFHALFSSVFCRNHLDGEKRAGCFIGVMWLLMFCGSSSLCRGSVSSLWLCYILIILTFLLNLSWVEKSVLRITVCHHETCSDMFWEIMHW